METSVVADCESATCTPADGPNIEICVTKPEDGPRENSRSGRRRSSAFLVFQSNERRKGTFEDGWTSPFANPDELAQAGFFYLGDEDRVQCAFCRGIISNWGAGDDPMMEHARHFPTCPVVMESPSDFSAGPWFGNRGQDVCGPISSSNDHSVPENGLGLLLSGQQRGDLKELGVLAHFSPVHEAQASEAARLRSFDTWSNPSVKKEELAKAGFFYIGVSDNVKCFCCDGGLNDWKPDDEPWVEHARWFQSCTFVLLIKGEEFVASNAGGYKKKQKLSRPCPPQRLSSAEVTHKADQILGQDDLVRSVVEVGLFPRDLVKEAVMRHIKQTGKSFENVDSLCEAIAVIQNARSVEVSFPIFHSFGQTEKENRHQRAQESKELPTISTNEVTTGSESKDTQCVASAEVPAVNEDRRKEELCLEETTERYSTKEIESVENFQLCKICMDMEISIVFLPCGHLITCPRCASSLKLCPVCRKNIKATIKAFMS